MKKVLIITYFFPPMNEIAALRIFGFAKYLPNFGWKPIILTVKKRQFQKGELPIKILKDVRKIKICETDYFDANRLMRKIFFRREKPFSESELFSSKNSSVKNQFKRFLRDTQRQIFNFPDGQIGWLRYGIKAGLDIIRNEKIDMIFSSSGPAIAHLIAYNLQKQTNLPWIADFRDLWTQNPYFKRIFPLSFFEKRLEIKIIKRARALITVSPGLAKKLKSLHGREVYVITNGFDEDFYKAIVPSSELFTITYTGRLYEGKQTPAPLFESLSYLFSKNKIDRNQVRMNFFGPESSFLPNLIKKYHLEDIVKIYGKVSLEKSIKNQKEATILLLLGWMDPKEKGIYTGKLFEYLGAQRPILAIGRKGTDVEKLLKETNAGLVARNIEEINRCLLNIWGEWKKRNEVKYQGKEEEIKRYTKKNLARNLANVFEKYVRG